MPRTKEPESALVDEQLYLGDNGRLFCGRQPCAGMTARATGRDLSGQPVELLSTAAAEYLLQQTGVEPECEGCGQKHTRPAIEIVGGAACSGCRVHWSTVDASGFCPACRLAARVNS